MNYLFIKKSDDIPILFLHGWGGSIDSFRLFFESFDRSLIAVDFPGFGKSADPIRPYCVLDFANEILQLLKDLRVDKVDVVAHSFGCRVAVKIASLDHDVIDKLLLTGAAGLRKKMSLRRDLRIYAYKMTKMLVKLCILHEDKLQKFGSDDYRVLNNVMRMTLSKVVNEDLSSDAKKVCVQTLLVFGRCDDSTPLWIGKRFEKLINNSELIILDGCGHFAYLERVGLFLEIALEFLGRN